MVHFTFSRRVYEIRQGVVCSEQSASCWLHCLCQVAIALVMTVHPTLFPTVVHSALHQGWHQAGSFVLGKAWPGLLSAGRVWAQHCPLAAAAGLASVTTRPSIQTAFSFALFSHNHCSLCPVKQEILRKIITLNHLSAVTKRYFLIVLIKNNKL